MNKCKIEISVGREFNAVGAEWWVIRSINTDLIAVVDTDLKVALHKMSIQIYNNLEHF